MRDFTVNIQGMSCGHCVAAVKRALETTAGVVVADVRIGAATGTFDEATTDLVRVTDAIEDAGYAVTGAP